VLPPLPPAFRDQLIRGAAELRLTLGEAQLSALDAYVRLLLAWTEAINLTAIREPGAVARDHILDSLSAVALLRAAGARRLLDLGSGGGLPGLPIAIALPDARVLLVDSVSKKAAFLRTAATALGLASRVDVSAERAEALALRGRERETFDAVTVRAVASLPELIELAFPLLHVGGRLVAWKREPRPEDLESGRAPLEAELEAGRAVARTLGGEQSLVAVPVSGLEHHRLVVVIKRRPTSPRFPRPPAERRANPLR
jgi:16S rRNA (guanine527-N7)-methyltransferase